MDAIEGEAASSSMPKTNNGGMEDEIEIVNISKNLNKEIEIASFDENDEELFLIIGGKQKEEYPIESDIGSDEEEEGLEIKMSVGKAANSETEKDEFAEESDTVITFKKDTAHISEELDIVDDEEVHEEDAKEEVKNEELVEAIPKKKIVKSRKKFKKGSKEIASKGMNEVIVKDKNPGEPLNKNLQIIRELDNKKNINEKVLEKEDENIGMCSEEKIEGISENGAGGVVHKEDAKECMKDEKQVEESYEKKINKSNIGVKKSVKKSIVLWDVNEVIVKDMNNPESSNKTTTKKRKIIGMIFMCSAKTKKDCYRYNVLGLPSNKRNEVLKISKGMKLFLFNVDLKLLYGIYEAAGPGGYNIEPKAFKSAFPSQVRFNVYEDCLPLPEEKFKKVIKDNYYQKNKFHSQLTLKQVNNLCKLFQAANKPERLWRDPEARTQKAPPCELRRSQRDVRSNIHKEEGKRRAETHVLFNRDRRQKRRTPETHAYVHEDRSRKRHRDAYGRDEYSSPVPFPPSRALLPPTSARELSPGSFAYEGRRSEMDGYRTDSIHERQDRRFRDSELRQGVHHDRVRDSFQEHHDRYILDSRLRHREEIEYDDPYVVYRNRPSYHDDRSYSDGRPSEYVDPARTTHYDAISHPRVSLYDSDIGTRCWY